MNPEKETLSITRKPVSPNSRYSIVVSEFFGYYVRDPVRDADLKGFENAIVFLKEIGYCGVEISLPMDRKLANRYGEILSSHRMVMSGIATGHYSSLLNYSLTSQEQSVRRQTLDTLLFGLSVARDLSAPLIIGLIRGKTERNEKSMSWLQEALKVLDRAAGDLNAGLLIEPINRYETSLINTISDSCALIENLGLENAGVLADSFHMNIEERDYYESIVSAGDRIWHVHFADSNRFPPGDGHLDFTRILDGLKAMNYSGWYSIECFPKPTSEDMATRSMRFLEMLTS